MFGWVSSYVSYRSRIVHSTYPSSLFARNPFVCSFCHYPEFTHLLSSSLFPESLGPRWCKRGRAVGFVWMCKQSGTGLPRAKSSFACICWNWWEEGVMTWSGERPHCSPNVDTTSNASYLPRSCVHSGQALSVEGVWQSDEMSAMFHICFLSFLLCLCFSALINKWNPVKAA